MADDDLLHDQSDSSGGAGEESPRPAERQHALTPDYMPLFVAPQPVERAESDEDDDGEEDADDFDDVDDGDQAERPAGRRRRRGRRGRGRGRG